MNENIKKSRSFYLFWIVMLVFLLFSTSAFSYSLSGSFEYGFLGVASHKVQFSNSGTYFDYVEEGGQDLLFPFSRFSIDLRLNKNSSLVFLYQPLALETQELLSRDILVDGQTFAAGTPVKFLYSFPFYRLSYLYDFNTRKDQELAIGFSLQIRDANIEFESLDGTLLRRNGGLGLVPVLKFRWRTTYACGWWLGFEADGFYAPISYINGSDSEVVGAILDASFRVGIKLPHDLDVFLNLRYLGGGAVGTDDDSTGPGDGYVKNWLHFVTVSLGITVSVF